MKILLIDDSPFMRSMLKGLLSQIELTDFLEAGNGHEGLKILEKNSINLILLDLHMPVMDGITFLSVIKNHPQTQHVPVIVVSSDTHTDLITEALNQGACSFINKPFRIENLKKALSKAIPKLR